MTMEIDQSHQRDIISSSGIIAADRQDLTPKLDYTEDQQITKHEKCDDEDDEDSDPGSMTCPLFMDGLPRNFATNPQLAAIASLLNDDEDVEENDEEENKSNEENDTNDNTKNVFSNQRSLGRASKDHTEENRLRFKSGNTRNRRQRQRHRASPYPRQQDRKSEKKASAKTTSVGEITLFMSMWKP